MRFYLNLRYRNRYFCDHEGDEFASVDEARRHALHTARDMIRRTRTQIIRDWFDCTFEITEAQGKIVLIVPFGDTVEGSRAES
jgi:uncharacterized protein DUF6894